MDFSAVTAFVAGFPDFVIHLAATIGLFVASLTIYILITPQKEFALIQHGNPSAALAFGGVVVGLAIPLGACLANAFGLLDLLIWGVITLLLQLFAFRIADMVLRDLPRRIAEGDVAAAIFLLSVKLALALILAGALQDPALSMIRSVALPAAFG
jgi:putative membrane protein